MEHSTHYPDTVRQWLTSPLGAALVQQESRVVEEALDGIFGEHCLQLGSWGEPNVFLRHARTQRKALLDVGAAAAEPASADVIGQLHNLPIQSDAIDCVILPHVLDYSDRPHAILREVDRVLTRDGHVVVLGFKTGGLWGVRRLIPGAGLPPEAQHLVPERRLKDWLQLLDMRIQRASRYFFRMPLPGVRGASSPKWEQRGQRWWPELAACYMIAAQKRVSTLTPVKPVWSHKPKVVAGLAETTNRVSRTSRIRFDRKN